METGLGGSRGGDVKKWLKCIFIFIAVAVIALWYALRAPTAPERFIMTGGEIVTMDKDWPNPEAVLVSNGKFSALGALADLQSQAPDVTVINLGGHVLTPGLIEPHTHPIATAMLGAVVDVSGFTYSDRASIIARLRKAADAYALTPWLVAFGWDPVAVADLKAPTLAELDAISPKRPMVILTQMMHEAYANSAAIKAAGIALDDESDTRAGVLRDASGHVTGDFRELAAVHLIMNAIPAPPNEVIELLVRRQYVKYARAGYTTIGIPGAVGRYPDPVGLIQKISDGPDSPLRSYLYLMQDQIGRLPLGGSDNFRVVGTKFWMDGSPFTGGAAVASPYADTSLTRERLGLKPGHVGPLTNDTPAFFNRVAEQHKAGYQIAFHVQGERAITRALEAIARARQRYPEIKTHHRLEHNALITKEQIARAVAMNVSLGFFVDHIYYYGDQLPSLFGSERAARYMPVNWALKAGALVTLHGDHPATPIGPLRTLGTAVSRQSRSGNTVTGRDQAISRKQAFAAMTINAARQLGQADKIGSISPSKLADFTIWSKSPLNSGQAGVAALETWRSGQPVNEKITSWFKFPVVWGAARTMLFGE